MLSQLSRKPWQTSTRNDLATIQHTSGTTGEPKGVMLSHGNLASNALAALEAFECRSDDLRLCWLPLSHIFARTADYYTWLAHGYQLALAQSRETLLVDLALLKPTVINGVPYFYDKLQRVLIAQGRADEPGALQQLLGGRMRFCCAGGAALPDHVAEFYVRQNVVLILELRADRVVARHYRGEPGAQSPGNRWSAQFPASE